MATSELQEEFYTAERLQMAGIVQPVDFSRFMFSSKPSSGAAILFAEDV